MALARLRNWFKQVTASKDRFKKGDKPTQAVYEDLFESIPFFKETSDAATESRQGLVELAANADILTRNTDDADGFEPVVQPHQLPIVSAADATVTVTPDLSAGDSIDYQVSRNAVVPGAWVDIGVFTVGNTDNEFDDGYQVESFMKYRIYDTNVIEIRGNVRKNKADTALIDLFQIPVTARPTHNVLTNCSHYSVLNPNNVETAILRISTAGKVSVFNVVGSSFLSTSRIINIHTIYTLT